MPRLTGYLRARLGRRIALLFFLCAVVPIAIFSMVTLRQAHGQLEEQSRERLRLLGKETAQALTYRLHAASLEAARWMGEGAHPDSLPGTFLADGPAGRGGRSAPPHVGEALRPASAGGGPAGGGPALAVSGSEVLLGLPAATGDSSLAWFVVHPDYIAGRRTPWGTEHVRAPLPAGVESCLIGPEGPITPCARALLEALTETVAAGESGRDFTWSADGVTRFAARRPVFLRAAFGADSWELVLSEPRDLALAPARGFRRTFLLAALLSLLIVPFASQIQIRRNLEPLARLEEGTRELAGGAFENRVVIDSGDEFEQLADSFNRMAGRLGRQFGFLRTTNEIDRAILGELHTEAILSTLIERAPQVLPEADVAVIVEDRDEGVRTYGFDTTVGRRLAATTSPEGLLRRAAGSDLTSIRIASATGGRSRTEVAAGPGREPADDRCHTLFPVRVDGSVPAAILVGTRGIISDEDHEHAVQMADRLAVALANARLVDELDRLNVETITAFARAIDAKSRWTAGHSERVADMALRIAAELDLPHETLELLRRGALLHDIGKIGVPGTVLDKPGNLTDEEFALMRAHTTMGATILEPISGLRRIIPIARHHHERFDGTGYPDGLSGEDIPYLARIVAVADVFDALTSARPYREAMPEARVTELLIGDAGTAFDPGVIAAFRGAMRNIPREEVA